MLSELTKWLNEVTGPGFLWYAKRLSGNDTLATGAHQAGPYIPKSVFFSVFPSLNKPDIQNPDTWFELHVDSHDDHRKVRAIWYNNKFHGGTRNESRLTNFGGQSSSLLDPESTGALTLFAFALDRNGEANECHVWVCRDEAEEILIEERIGPVDPGTWAIWTTDRSAFPGLFAAMEEEKPRRSCWLEAENIPKEWLTKFPAGLEIIRKVVELRPAKEVNPDIRLLQRRDCEFELFKSLEEVTELPRITKGFNSIDEFIARAQTILQRRKARSGRSLELHAKEIFLEEGLVEEKDFSHQPESEPGKEPDFLFPSEDAYKDSGFNSDKLRMLAVKTTCKDRWRQILNEADRIKTKHLLTLQEGISENQFKEMKSADVQLVVPVSLISSYPKAIRQHLETLENFIKEISGLRK